MMTSFYAALMEGKTKQQAFQEAQQQVKNQGFTDPYYWGAFILLDGVF
jgi:CHAT domain-containing protein